MTHALIEYLSKRLDRPTAWVTVFGGCLMAALAAVGYSENGLAGASEGAVMGLIAGMAVGLVFGSIVWLICRLAGGLDRPVQRPGLWALHLRCTRCEYETTPDGPWRVRDCLTWPEQCPLCEAALVLVTPTCPRCDGGGLAGKSTFRDFLSQVRWPRSLGQALWGGYTCKECQCVYDKWGREVPPVDPPGSV